MDLGLTGMVAIVTGASRGLGREAALSLAAEGVSVLAAARSNTELDELERMSEGQIRAVHCDMRDRTAVTELPARAIETFGRVDIIVNNAGIAPAALFNEQDFAIWDEVFAVNVHAPALLARAAGPIFLQQRSGKVINIASTSGILGKASLVAYSASKGALIQFTKALSAEWAPHGIQVNVIAPGAFVTDAQAYVTNNPDIRVRRIRKIPAGRMAEPAEIGSLVCYLASPRSNFVSGAVYVIDGGETAKQ
jgi:2-dehydro-3-deoxy-D-gluconate 5-dehydrogenase